MAPRQQREARCHSQPVRLTCVALDYRLAAIFEAWFDYDHATDEDAKAVSKAKRNELIDAALKEKKSHATITDFLRAFRDDYRKWMIDTRLKQGNRKRF